MSFRNLMVISAVIALGFGLGLVLIPESLLSLYGLALGQGEGFEARLLGIEFVGFGLIAWLVRDEVDPLIKRILLFVFLIADSVAFIVALIGQLSGLMNMLGWSVVGIFLLLVPAWAYLLFVRPKTY